MHPTSSPRSGSAASSLTELADTKPGIDRGKQMLSCDARVQEIAAIAPNAFEKQEDTSCMTPQGVLRSFPREAFAFAGSNEFFKEKFEHENIIWLHQDPIPTSLACRKYADHIRQNGCENIHWIDAGKSPEELLCSWKNIGMQYNPKWKRDIPANFPLAFEQMWGDNPYLIILTNVTIEHLTILTTFLGYVKKKGHCYLIVSKEQLKKNSFTIDHRSLFDNADFKVHDIESLKQRFPDYISFSLAISWIKKHRLEVEAFLGQLPSSCSLQELLVHLEKVEPNLIHCLRKLSLLGRAPLRKDGLEDPALFGSDFDALYQIMLEYNITTLNQDTFSVHPDILDALQIEEEQKKELIKDLIHKLRAYLDSPFKDSKKEWIIQHTRAFFNAINPRDLRLKEQAIPRETSDLILSLVSLMLDIGHYYTQNGDPILAQEVSVEARDRFEREFIPAQIPSSKKQKKQKTTETSDTDINFKDATNCIPKLFELHPEFPYLYINLQYQIGRSYFYHKSPDDKLGSLAVLKHAKTLCESLKIINKEPTLLSILIERNGLLFHAMEDKEFEKAIEGYIGLLKREEEHFNFDFKSGERSLIVPIRDSTHCENCLKYLVHAQTECQRIEERDLNALSRCIDSLSPEKKISPLLILCKALIEKKRSADELEAFARYVTENGLGLKIIETPKNDLERMNNELYTLLSRDFAQHQQLDLMRIHICWYAKLQCYERLSESSKKYREQAVKYYPEGERAIYDAWFFENSAVALKPTADSPSKGEKPTFDSEASSLLTTKKSHFIDERGLNYLNKLDAYIRAQAKKQAVPISSYDIEEGHLILKIGCMNEQFKQLIIALRQTTPECVSFTPKGNIRFNLTIDGIDALMTKLDDLMNKLTIPPSPTQISSSQKRELKEEEREEGITLHAGDDRTLFIAKPLVDYLKRMGEWEELKKEMVETSNLINGSNKFFSSAGYRLKLGKYKEAGTDATSFDPLPAGVGSDNDEEDEAKTVGENATAFNDSSTQILTNVPDSESWSDDSDHEDNYAECLKSISNDTALLQKKRVALEQKSTFFDSFEMTRVFEKKLEKDFQIGVKNYKKEREQHAGISTSVRQMAEIFCNHMQSPLTTPLVGRQAIELKEYCMSYIEQKSQKMEYEVRPSEKVRLEKIDKEMEYLQERLNYLLLKKENLHKHRICANVETKKAFCQEQDELRADFAAISSKIDPHQIKPILIELPFDHRDDVERLHFSHPFAFIYHTLKHESPPPFIYNKETGAITFSLAQFETNACSYLKKTRSLIREATLVCPIPDQIDPRTTNYRYFKFLPAPGEIDEILTLQQDIAKKKMVLAKLSKEKRNCQYSDDQIYTEKFDELNKEINRHSEEKKRLEKTLTNLLNMTSERECEFTVLASQQPLRGGSIAHIRTQFSKIVNLTRLPNAQIASLFKASVNEEKADSRLA